jgi:hypothetical protein
MMGWGIRVLIGTWLFASLAFPIGIAAEPLPQSVLVLNQSVPLSPFSRRFTTEFLSELTRTSPTHVTIYPEFLDLGRFGWGDSEQAPGAKKSFIEHSVVWVMLVTGLAALAFSAAI